VPRTQAWPSRATVGLAASLLGCGDPLPEPYWQGEHIILAAEEPERVCGGTAEYLDRRTGELFEKLGTDPIDVEFYLLNDVDDHCLDEVVGCAIGSVVYAERVPLLHEIVHARANDGWRPTLAILTPTTAWPRASAWRSCSRKTPMFPRRAPTMVGRRTSLHFSTSSLDGTASECSTPC
jgi:hypothetical protein